MTAITIGLASVAVSMVLAGCSKPTQRMSANPLPAGIAAGETVPHESIYGEPPESPDANRVLFFGMRAGDKAHRIYSMPADTSLAEVVRAFNVGAHGAESYGYEVNETVDMVAGAASKISELVPCRVTFADAAGLKLKFTRQVTEDELGKIEALFPEENQMQMGLDRYLSEWDGEGPCLSPVLKENLIHLWWD